MLTYLYFIQRHWATHGWGRLCLLSVLLAACASATPTPPTPTAVPLPKAVSFYTWAGYISQEVFDAFEQTYGIQVVVHEYGSQEEAIANIQQGQVFDVVVIGNEQIPAMLTDQLLAELNYANIPNFKNVSANFRDLAYDAQNRHSVPFMWGSSGLVVRTDLVSRPITSWNDLWDPAVGGKVGVWDIEGWVFAFTLQSMGKSINTTRRADLDAALAKMLLLKKNTIPIDLLSETVVPDLSSGKCVLAYGWSYDYAVAQAEGLAVEYVLPQEGTLLWGDNLVIPANSPHQYAAELLINFILQPAMNAKFIQALSYATAVDAARDYLPPEIRDDPAIYPSNTIIQKSEIALPLPEDFLAYRHQLWLTYLAAER